MDYFHSFLWVIFILICTNLSAQLDLDLSQSESVCSSDGSITGTAGNGTPPYQYRIVSGPNLRGFQTSGTFLALQPGDYTVEVRDASFITASASINVEGNYILPSLSVSVAPPTCSNSTDGQAVLNGSNGNMIGTAEFPTYKYRIVDLTTSPQTIIQEQSTDTFVGLTEGTYTFQIEDGCQNRVSETITLTMSATIPFNGAINFIGKSACDTYEAEYRSRTGGTFPHSITVTEDATGTTVFSGTVDSNSVSSIGTTYNFGVNYTANIVDACGQTENLTFIQAARSEHEKCKSDRLF